MQKVKETESSKAQDIQVLTIRLPKRDHIRLRVAAAMKDQSMAGWAHKALLAALDGGIENAQTIKT